MMKTKRQKGKAEREAARKRREQEAHKQENKKVEHLTKRIIENLSRQKVDEETPALDIHHLLDSRRNMPKRLSEESTEGGTKQRYPRATRRIVLLLSGILSLVLGGPILWEIPSADPIVKPPAEPLDPQNPFAAPFTIFNKLYFHTLYHVQGSCYFDKRSTALMSNIELVREADVANIAPGRAISYTCPVEAEARPGISIVIRVQYEVRMFSLFSRRGEIEVPFPLREGPHSEFHWVEGGYITKRGPEIWNGM